MLLSLFMIGIVASDDPRSAGLAPEMLARVDVVTSRAVESRAVPGAIVLIGRGSRIGYAKAFGRRAVVPAPEAMTRDTIFDLASLTKPLATATAIMILVDRGRLVLDDRLETLLPEFDNRGKGLVTVEQLLRHRSGLVADNPIADFADGPEAAWRRLADLALNAPPGLNLAYSDVGYMVLGRVVERLTGRTLDEFTREEIYKPLGMLDTGFRPADPARVAPTEPADGEMLRGLVHDPRARALGGVAGHAGLFGTADDLAKFARMMLDGGLAPDGRRVLSAESVRRMTDPGDTPPRQRRGLGWDVDTAQSTPRGLLFGPGFGHTGFTGTSLWVDPSTATYVVVLTSRLHPDGKGASPSMLRSDVATLAAAAVVEPIVAARPVLCGVDVLARDGFAALKGLRVGLITNHTGLLRDGRTTVEALHKAPGVALAALFSPEHGPRGAVDAEVADGRDEATGVPVFSLYGKDRKPSAASLAGVDALVFDIQDIGTRFYTYISTLGLAMEAARDRGVPFYVLDRPNPIGGVAVEGPVRDPDFASFIAHHALPVRHGMTVGELAGLYNAERKIGVDLRVIPVEGWRRADLFDRTGLLWVDPSPNMRSPTEALLYPGVGLLETTNLATGRGTDTPFERVGAPWIEPRAFAAALNALGLPGVRFVPVRFTPKERQHAGKPCGGVYIQVVDRDRVEPVALGIGLACVLRATYRDEWKPDGLLTMLADRDAYQAVIEGKPIAEVEASWRAELADFMKVRARYLIYK